MRSEDEAVASIESEGDASVSGPRGGPERTPSDRVARGVASARAQIGAFLVKLFAVPHTHEFAMLRTHMPTSSIWQTK